MSGQLKLRNKNTEPSSDKGTAKPLNSPKTLSMRRIAKQNKKSAGKY